MNRVSTIIWSEI